MLGRRQGTAAARRPARTGEDGAELEATLLQEESEQDPANELCEEADADGDGMEDTEEERPEEEGMEEVLPSTSSDMTGTSHFKPVAAERAHEQDSKVDCKALARAAPPLPRVRLPLWPQRWRKLSPASSWPKGGGGGLGANAET